MGNELRKQLTKRRSAESGMTLIEIMIVIAIMGVMMGVAAVALIPRLHEAKVSTVYQDFKTIDGAMKLYYAKKGKYPDTAQGLKVLVDQQLLEKAPLDPWGTEYGYLNEGGKPVIVSYGANKESGGSENDQDLFSNKPQPE
ncbi:MAG: type II secretion system protein GspG [Myxococcaceae bacterium]